MATILSICRYISTILVVVTLCTFPTCDCGKKRKLSTKHNPNSGLRLIKVFHKRYSRKLKNVRTLEDFLQVFEKNENVEQTDQALPVQRLLQHPNNEQNDSTVSSQMQQQMSAIECREPKPVILNTYDVMGLTQGYLQWIMPKCILVNRCGKHSGCCGDEGKSCTVAQGYVRNVTRQVAIGSVYLGSSTQKTRPKTTDSVEIRTIEVEEHTRCACKQLRSRNTRNCGNVRCPDFKTKDPITCRCSCPKRCPYPYGANPDTCECECSTNSTSSGRECRKIYRGKSEIKHNECRCIRRKQCNVPACRSRHHFNNTTCNCVPNQVDERNADGSDSYGGLFAAKIEVRSQKQSPPREISSDEERILEQPLVRSMQRSGSDGGNQRKVDPKLGTITPEASEYRHASHTSYNDTYSVHAKHNASGSTKAKITVWEKSSDDLNATNIKDKSNVSLKRNGTEHQTISTRKSANLNPLLNVVPHLSERPAQEGDTNFINAHVPGEEDVMVTMDTGESVDIYHLFSSSGSISSYSSLDSLDKNVKEEDILDLFSDEAENEDLETYKFAESSGDYKFGGY